MSNSEPALSESTATVPVHARDVIRAELAEARTAFYALLDSLPEDEWQARSLNPGWSNGEILVHMLFGFIILFALLPMVRLWGRLPRSSSRPFAWLLNASTGLFNWFNALGARLQARIFTHRRIGRAFDQVYSAIIRQLDSIHVEEWGHGMYYPTRWDANFEEFMTVEKLFHYTVNHFRFHEAQIRLSRGARPGRTRGSAPTGY